MNSCPHCGEAVLEMATNCRHCGQTLDDKTFCLDEKELANEILKAKEDLVRNKAARQRQATRLKLVAGVLMVAGLGVAGVGYTSPPALAVGALLLAGGAAMLLGLRKPPKA